MKNLFRRETINLIDVEPQELAHEIGKDTMLNISDMLEDPVVRNQVIFISTLVAIIVALRMMAETRITKFSARTYDLNMKALNNALCVKEVMVSYLCAAILEPVLSIAGSDAAEGTQFTVDCLMLGSICWWIWLMTDAFDCMDITQQFKFCVEFREAKEENPTKYKWLNLQRADEIRSVEKAELAGTVQRDVALWLLLGCICSAWMPGAVTHRDVTHAYGIVFMWAIIHHSCHTATCWGTNYFVSFLCPSTALLPMEYCLPFMDTLDFIDDIDGAGDYVKFIKRRTGVSLIVVS